MLLAIFGINNDAVNLVISLLLLVLGVLYLTLIYWTFADARRRLDDLILITCAVVTSIIFPFVGTIIYTILRPPEFLEDVHERDLEIRSAELRLRELEATTCPRCAHHVHQNYLVCVNCGQRLKHPCPSCRRPVSPRWKRCPYCEFDLAQGSGKRRRPSRGGAQTAAAKKRSGDGDAEDERGERQRQRDADGGQHGSGGSSQQGDASEGAGATRS
ncbi:MAG: zinc ribbon domain-containing protein [Solirubrobacterales bacterium]